MDTKEDLKNKAIELEQTLQAQLNFLKTDSKDFVKIGAGVLLGGLTAFGIVKAIKGKKNSKNKRIMEVLEKEGLLDKDTIERLNTKKSTGFKARMVAVLLPMIIAYGREKLMGGNQKNDEQIGEPSEGNN
ncbi:hypothetical protein MM236_07230 [Belliella sp. DSM 107340]|uniref:YtxH-like protein n=1 Tax=Belliella calami TaxID=2923436 RepID=A0ABS9UME6_9BACT|nr:hypothetical protein [Belliella calami]MCH7397773.1 hypothetical protein [Belliella calami]